MPELPITPGSERRKGELRDGSRIEDGQVYGTPVIGPDKRPATIKVYACPECGYWRSDKSTGVHRHYDDNGPGKVHQLVETAYAR